jgi:hypothetical protein
MRRCGPVSNTEGRIPIALRSEHDQLSTGTALTTEQQVVLEEDLKSLAGKSLILEITKPVC